MKVSKRTEELLSCIQEMKQLLNRIDDATEDLPVERILVNECELFCKAYKEAEQRLINIVGYSIRDNLKGLNFREL